MGFSTEKLLVVLFHILCHVQFGFGSTWSEWWTYDGISGPEFWGLVNPEWYLCQKGRKQSPINIDPRELLYDSHLKHLHIDKHRMSGVLVNTGHDVKLYIDESGPHTINITGGPYQYKYRVSEILIHFGSTQEKGSEHTIDNHSFPAELQIVAYNSDLYGNMTQAVYSSNGLAVIAVLLQIGKTPNPELDAIAQSLKLVRHKGKQVRIRHLSVHGLLPETNEYMTYEGSMTQPGCHETVSWVVMNRPMYVTNEQLTIMRDLLQTEEGKKKILMEKNCRPTMPVHTRPVRSNINFPNANKGCTMEKNLHYQANIWDRS